MNICTLKSLPVELEDDAQKLALGLHPMNGMRTGVMRMNKRWPMKSTITVVFLDGSAKQKESVQPYFHEWMDHANVKFVFILNKWNANVRVSFREGEGAWSVLGTDALVMSREEPSMVLGWVNEGTEEEEIARVTRHEVGHVLGFEHELASPGGRGIQWDESRVLEYYMGPPNNWTEDEVRRQVLSKLVITDDLKFTDFDPHSIMCYATPARFTKDGIGTPWNTHLSPTDIKLVRECYP